MGRWKRAREYLAEALVVIGKGIVGFEIAKGAMLGAGVRT
jgi:hypothetical protein